MFGAGALRGAVCPHPAGDELWYVIWGSWDPELCQHWLVVLAVTVSKNRDCAVGGRGGLSVLLHSNGERTQVGGTEPVKKQRPPGHRLCWEHPHLLPKTFLWVNKYKKKNEGEAVW